MCYGHNFPALTSTLREAKPLSFFVGLEMNHGLHKRQINR